jgi:hypothetical protein
MEFTESTSNPRSPSLSNEIWCLVQEGLLDSYFLKKQLIAKYIHRLFSGNSFQALTKEEQLYGRFQQDSATAHTARMSDVFGDRIISSDIWPTRYPILHLVIFLLRLFAGQSLQQ